MEAPEDPHPGCTHTTHHQIAPNHIHHPAPKPVQGLGVSSGLLSKMDPMIALQAVTTHAQQQKCCTLVLVGEMRMKLAPPWATCQNMKGMWILQMRALVVGALVVRAWKARKNQKVRAPTMKAVAVRARSPAVTMRNQAVAVAAEPQSLMKYLQRPSQTNHPPLLPWRWTTMSCRLP